MSTRCCTIQSLGGGQSNRVGRGTPASRQRRLPHDSVVRNEFKYDLFDSDLSDVIHAIERDYEEIKRPAPATLTLYFYDPARGAPEVDPFFRLRTYANFDVDAASLDDIKMLPWQVEKKCGHEKRPLGSLDRLPASIEPGDEVWDLLGETRRPNLLKVSMRRHFAIDETRDESQRVTVDLSRSVFKIVGHRLVPLGDIGPRVEVKLPKGRREDSLPMTGSLRAASYWMPFGSMANYFQFLLRRSLPMETHLSLPEIESKFAVTSGSPEQVFDELFAFLCAMRGEWRFLLPYPHIITRTRRYHVCQGRPNSTATVVETASGRCSLKIKQAARRDGAALLRSTQASHTTDLDGVRMTPEEFALANRLTKINEFAKVQRKIPVSLGNGHAFQFSLDRCVDPSKRSLAQIEIEYIGSTDGRTPAAEQILDEIHDVARMMLASPLGAHLESTHVSKHAFFAGNRIDA
jgi:hypothetical protein